VGYYICIVFIARNVTFIVCLKMFGARDRDYTTNRKVAGSISGEVIF
jgi:hypothetical protein